MAERFIFVAKANHRSISGELRYLIERRIEESEAKVKEAA